MTNKVSAIMQQLYCCMFISVFYYNTVVAAATNDTPLETVIVADFKTCLSDAIQAFKQKDFKTAVHNFENLEQNYGSEKAYKSKQLQTTILPIWAYCYLADKTAEKAVQKLQTLLKDYKSDLKQGQEFAIYTLAHAYKQSGDAEQALKTFEKFKKLFPKRPEASIAWLEQADILFSMNKTDDAFNTLEEFYAHKKSAPEIRIQGRLMALQAAGKLADQERAKDLLFNTPWKINKMPELGILTHTAIKIGDMLMDKKDYKSAIRAYRNVPDKKTLMSLQKQRFQSVQLEAEQKLKMFRRKMHNVHYYEQYYSKLITTARTQLEQLENSEDYTPGYLLKLGQAFLMSEREYEAQIVFEKLSKGKSIDPKIAEDAHYRWILTAYQMKNYEHATTLALSFSDRYPDSPLAQKSIFMLAGIYRELEKYEEAISLLAKLINTHPNHSDIFKWLFLKSYMHLQVKEYPSAVTGFMQCAGISTDDYNKVKAKYWQGMTLFINRQYPEAKDHFNQLHKTTKQNRFIPEIIYRLSYINYILKDFDAALELSHSFIAKFQLHAKAADTYALQGDILAAKGDSAEALLAYKNITKEYEKLYNYSTFQIGKILRKTVIANSLNKEIAQEYCNRLIQHFTDYINHVEADNPGTAEALCWISWGYIKSNDINAAESVIEKAIKEYGNTVLCEQVPLLLKQLQGIYKKKYQNGERDFEAWLEAERKESLKDFPTYYSRLSLYLSDLYTKQKNTIKADSIMREISGNVQVSAMDANALGRIGFYIHNSNKENVESDKYFKELLNRYPKSRDRAYAYLGLAESLYKNKHSNDAKKLLEISYNEIPGHKLSASTAILLAKIYTDEQNYESAKSIFEEVLSTRSSRGKAHAEALLGLAELFKNKNEPKKAIACYQRIYTSYRAYPIFLAIAYKKSADLFYQLGEVTAALNTLNEMLGNSELNECPEYKQAEVMVTDLKNSVTLEDESNKNEPKHELASIK